jgi:pimeloyl-ACP methyl ester carboxylesterase
MPPAPLVQQFREAGYKVVSPEMGWSRETAYSINYEASLERVNAEVESLRQQGFKKVVLGGQSFGANGALAYASIYSNVDALLLFAPGHNPDIDRNRNPFKVNEAKALISSAQPDKLITFTDFNDGSRTQDFSISPQAYLSYFDPDGLASMPKTAINQKKAIPVLVFMGRSDLATRQGTWYFFNRLPKHPANKYVVSDAEHRQVPQASFPSALQWVESHVLQ